MLIVCAGLPGAGKRTSSSSAAPASTVAEKQWAR
jgi:hypothetical protein